jgi:hypothetical protein
MRRRGPVGIGPRRRPSIVGTVARTAVIAGTATAVSRGVSGAMSSSQQKAQQQAAAVDMAAQNQADIDAMAAQMEAMQAQQAQAAMAAQAPAAPAAPSNDLMSQLQQLSQMKDAGILSEEEFAAAKAKLLAS